MMPATKRQPQTLALPFPMRGGAYIAQLVIPRDMTKAEASRLCAFITAMIRTDEPPVVERRVADASDA